MQGQGSPQVIAGPGQSQPETQGFRPRSSAYPALLPASSAAGPVLPSFLNRAISCQRIKTILIPFTQEELNEATEERGGKAHFSQHQGADCQGGISHSWSHGVMSKAAQAWELNGLTSPRQRNEKPPPERTPAVCQGLPHCITLLGSDNLIRSSSHPRHRSGYPGHFIERPSPLRLAFIW